MRQQRIVRNLFILYLLFIYYNVLIPFQFSFDWSVVARRLHEIEFLFYSPRGHISLTDIAGNILLFIPFGFLLFALLQRLGPVRAVVLTAGLGTLVSCSIEFLQLFVADRHTSFNDVLTNTTGAFLGATMATVYFSQISRLVRRWFYQLLDAKPFLLLVVLIALAQYLAAIMPFTVSITISHFKKSLKAVNLFPFTYQSLGSWLLGAPNKHDLVPFDWFAFFGNVLYWTAGGYLLYLCYRIYWKDKPYGKWFLYGAPLAFFCFQEFSQVFITSRITDINDIISSYLGLLLGFAIYRLARPLRLRTFHHHLDLLGIPVLMYLVYLVYAGLQPFDFQFTLVELKSEMALNNLVPFYAYFKTASLFHIEDLVNGLVSFMPVTLYWSARIRGRGLPFSAIYPRTVAAGLALGLFIELAQLFSPERVAEITDVLTYGLSGGLGTWLLSYYEAQVKPQLALYRQGLIRL